MPTPSFEKVAFLFYGAGLTAGSSAVLYEAVADEPNPKVRAASISATFLLSVLGGTIRTWANPKTSWAERMASTAASVSLAIACVSNASGETRVATFATMTGGTFIGAWNAAMIWRLRTPEPPTLENLRTFV